MNTVNANPSTAQTNTVLVAAVATKTVKVRSLYISSDTAMTVSIENSTAHSTFLAKLYVGADGGIAIGPDAIGDSMWTIDGEGVDFTTSANGNVFIQVSYELV